MNEGFHHFMFLLALCTRLNTALQAKLARGKIEDYYIHTEIYAPKSIEIKIVSSRWRSQLIGHTIFFFSEKQRIDALIGYIIIFTSEQNRVTRRSS